MCLKCRDVAPSYPFILAAVGAPFALASGSSGNVFVFMMKYKCATRSVLIAQTGHSGTGCNSLSVVAVGLSGSAVPYGFFDGSGALI